MGRDNHLYSTKEVGVFVARSRLRSLERERRDLCADGEVMSGQVILPGRRARRGCRDIVQRRRLLQLQGGGHSSQVLYLQRHPRKKVMDDGRHQLELLLGGLVIWTRAFRVARSAFPAHSLASLARSIAQSMALDGGLATVAITTGRTSRATLLLRLRQKSQLTDDRFFRSGAIIMYSIIVSAAHFIREVQCCA